MIVLLDLNLDEIMNVQILEISTGKVVGIYPIILGGQNFTPSEHHYFDEAWRCAVEDGIVLEQQKDKYKLSFSN